MRCYNLKGPRADTLYARAMPQVCFGQPFPSRPRPRPATSGPWISAHCDGGARGNPGPAGFGALIQDAEGRVLAELSEFLGTQTNNFAEYSGLLASLDYALSHGHRRVRVISDSELMVKQIWGSTR